MQDNFRLIQMRQWLRFTQFLFKWLRPKKHNIPETLIKPSLVDFAGILLGEGEKSKVEQVSLCNVTVKSRIADMACDIKSQLIENIKTSPVFGILLDESVDSANFSQSMAFVRYIHNKPIEEDFLAAHWK